MTELKDNRKTDKKELIAAGILTVVLAFMDISGLPCTLFLNIEIPDVAPFYWALMLNFALIVAIAFLVLRFFCPSWELGLQKNGFLSGFVRYGAVGIAVGLITAIAFCVGLLPFDYKPTVLKVLIEGIVYYFGVAFVEELYVRGLLLNLLEKMFTKRRRPTETAIIASSLVFGIGHIFGTLGQPLLVIVAKVMWTITMGFYFGMVYKKTNNLWLPVILHFLMDISALPYCFSTMQGYADISLAIILPLYVLLGIYSLHFLKSKR